MSKPYVKEQPKEIDVDRVINHLNTAFENVTVRMGRPVSPWVVGKHDTVSRNSDHKTGNDLYRWQVEYSYMVDDIKRGASYMAPKTIAECNELIAQIDVKRKQPEAA